MTTLADHARSLVAYTVWADARVLDAAGGLDEDGWSQVRGPFAHMLGTRTWWHANWTHVEWQEPTASTLGQMRVAYEASNDALTALAHRLTDEDWQRAEPWWQRWGYDATLPLGETLSQVVLHGVQHRAEIALALTERGCSPGDLDYLVYLREMHSGLQAE